MDSYVLPPVALAELDTLSARAATVIARLRERVYAPGTQKALDIQPTATAWFNPWRWAASRCGAW